MEPKINGGLFLFWWRDPLSNFRKELTGRWMLLFLPESIGYRWLYLVKLYCGVIRLVASEILRYANRYMVIGTCCWGSAFTLPWSTSFHWRYTFRSNVLLSDLDWYPHDKVKLPFLSFSGKEPYCGWVMLSMTRNMFLSTSGLDGHCRVTRAVAVLLFSHHCGTTVCSWPSLPELIVLVGWLKWEADRFLLSSHKKALFCFWSIM